MAKNSIAKNYIYNLIYQILVTIVPLVTTPYLSRVLGAENIGIYSYTLSITTYFILFGSLGVAMYGQREIAYVQDKIYERSKNFFEILIMRFITLGISLIIFYFSFCIDGKYNLYYRILILEIIANSLDISWFFQGLEEFKKTVIRNTIVKFISIICIFVFVKTINDLNIYFFIYVISTFLGNVSLWIYLPKFINKIKFGELNILKHFKPTINLFIPQIAVQIYTVLDKTMIGAMVEDKSEVGYYEQSQKIIKFLLSIATSLGTVMIPRIANTYANGNYKRIKEYMYNSFKFVMLIAFPMMFGIISITRHFVPFFFGNGYEKVEFLMCITSPIIVIIGLSNVIGKQYLLPTKQQKKYTLSVVTGALTNVILNYFLIQKFESIGASVATILAECVVTMTQFYMIKNEISFGRVIKMSYKYILSSIIMFLISIIIGYFINNNFVSICIQTCVSIVVYFVLLIIMKDEYVLVGLKKVRR